MKEFEIHQYLLREYSQENSRCEWEEFKNLKTFSVVTRKTMLYRIFLPLPIWMGTFGYWRKGQNFRIFGTDTYKYDR